MFSLFYSKIIIKTIQLMMITMVILIEIEILISKTGVERFIFLAFMIYPGEWRMRIFIRWFSCYPYPLCLVAVSPSLLLSIFTPLSLFFTLNYFNSLSHLLYISLSLLLSLSLSLTLSFSLSHSLSYSLSLVFPFTVSVSILFTNFYFS